MNCWNCGTPAQPGEKFCSNCGAELSKAPGDGEIQEGTSAPEGEALNQNPVQEPGYQEPPQGETYQNPQQGGYHQNQAQNNGGAPQGPGPGMPNDQVLSMLPKIYGYVLAALFAIGAPIAIFRAVGYILRVLTAYNFSVLLVPRIVLTILVYGIDIILGLAIAVVCFIIGARWKKDNADGAFIILSLISLGRPLLTFVLYAVTKPVTYVGTTLQSLLIGELKGITMVVILFVISMLNGVMPLIGKTKEDIKFSLASFVNSGKGAGEALFQKANQGKVSAGQYSAGTNAAQGYTAQTGTISENKTTPPPQGTGGFVPMSTSRNILLIFLLSFITCGIYGLYLYYEMARDANIMCDGDGKHTDGLLMHIALTIITCGIYGHIWNYAIQERLRDNAERYGVIIEHSGLEVILWSTAGLFLCGLGPWIGLYLTVSGLNTLSRAYNAYNGF